MQYSLYISYRLHAEGMDAIILQAKVRKTLLIKHFYKGVILLAADSTLQMVIVRTKHMISITK